MSAAAQPIQRLLIIDDDRELCALIAEYLRPLHYAVQAVHNGPEGVERVRGEEFHAVILDVMLPGMDGFEVLRQIRAKSRVPVLMLTARGEETDRIVGLEMGADDYLPKTFSSRELLARLRAVTRRHMVQETAEGEEIEAGPLRVRLKSRVAELDGEPLKLTALEFDLLVCLARARGRVKTRERLIEEIGERLYDGLDRSVDVHICSLRRKLGDDSKTPRFIKTVRAAGYMFSDEQ